MKLTAKQNAIMKTFLAVFSFFAFVTIVTNFPSFGAILLVIIFFCLIVCALYFLIYEFEKSKDKYR